MNCINCMLILTIIIILTVSNVYSFGSFDDFFTDDQFFLLKKYTSVSFHSQCLDATNQTPVNMLAKQMKDVGEATYIWDDHLETNHIEYNDICNDTDLLLGALVDMLLDQKYFFQPEGNNTVWRYQNILYLLAVVPDLMSQMIENVFSFSDTLRACGPRSCDQRLNLKSIDDQALQLMSLLQHFQWYDVTLITLSDYLDDYWSIFLNKTSRLLRESENFCLKVKLFDTGDSYDEFVESMIEIKDFLMNTRNHTKVFIWGGRHTLVQSFFSELREVFLMHFSNFPMIFPYGEFHHSSEKTPSYYQALPWLVNYQEKRSALAVGDLGIDAIKQAAYKYRGRYNEKISLQKTLEQVAPYMGHSYVLPYYQDISNIDGLFFEDYPVLMNWSKTFLQEVEFRKEPCNRLRCEPGFQQVYGSIDNPFFDEMYGFKCVLCPVNHIKPFYGVGRCMKCNVDPFVVDNGDRTVCVDPYSNVDIHFTQMQTYLVLGTGLSCILLTLIIFIVFIVKRNTPIVRSSDKVLSMLHLPNILLTIASLLYLNLVQKVTIARCIAANLIISVFYVINVAFVYTKSQKLLTAFRSSIHLSRKEIRLTSAVQVFIVAVFLLTSNAITIITFTQESANIINFLDDDQMLRIHYCNTGHHENVLIAFIACLQMLCLIQAYRGRHLPGPMNNAMSLVYAVLIATINFLISFPITAFLDQVDKEFARLIVLITNCIFIVLLLYGQKCYLIMFKPRKNTRHYFTEKRMEAMSSTSLPTFKRTR